MLAGWHASCLGHFSLVERATGFKIETNDKSLKSWLSDLTLIYTQSLNEAGLRLERERSHLVLLLWPVSFVSIKSIRELN